MEFSKQTIRHELLHLFFICSLLCVSNLSLCFSLTAYAETELSQLQNEVGQPSSEQPAENDVGFTVEPVLTTTQIDQSKGFFFIKVKPDEPQELVIKVKSTNKEPAKVTIYVSDAFTNQNGAVDYDGEEYPKDDTLQNSLEEITTVSNPEITVQNFEEKEVTIKVSPPKESFEGVKCAAICVMKSGTEESDEGLTSLFGYRVGLVVTEDSEIYTDGSSLNLLSVKPTVHQGKRVIQARLQNPEPKILDDLTVETKLRKKGEKEVLRKRTTNDMRMAPNSQFDFATNWGLDPIQSGTYVLSVKADSGENTWSWEEEFTIGEKEAKKINEEATYTITYPSWVPLVVVMIGTATLANIGSLYVRRKKWTKEG